ncbi:hypothetical protein DFO66_106146 [Brevibacterium sanguinis]|uniref:Uncharacterized protein n=2 Tax=Brevibacterium TaxID=1696 RepID=A0A366IK01_9MICO|nr:hypothetical protein DFO66_106146 [Brevibacterium sanguinis]RBP71610.1 hypothetical protein DFO65_105215 [Brevibacterium celere]
MWPVALAQTEVQAATADCGEPAPLPALFAIVCPCLLPREMTVARNRKRSSHGVGDIVLQSPSAPAGLSLSTMNLSHLQLDGRSSPGKRSSDAIVNGQ